jgi:hypothetical protein
LQHHCDPAIRNVEQFGKKGGKLGNRGNRHLADKVMTFKPTLTRSIGKEEELLIDYGENFCELSISVSYSLLMVSRSSQQRMVL